MANTPRPTSAGTREVSESAAPLTSDEQSEILENDSADNAVKAPAEDLSGKRIRGIPAVITKNGDTGTTIEILPEHFKANGIDHEKVVFDARNGDYTLRVGDGEDDEISTKAAAMLVKKFPYSFEYMDSGE